MLSPEQLNGKKLALLLVGEDDSGEDDWAVFSGVGRWDGSSLWLDRGGDEAQFELLEEWLDGVRKTDAETRSILVGAEFFLPLPISNLPEGAAQSVLQPTALKWPESEG